MSKTCSKCKVKKEITEFPKGTKYSDGRRGVCKVCDKAYSNIFQIKEGEYTCTECNKHLPFTEFYKCNQNKNGLRSACKSCKPAKNTFTHKYNTNNNIKISHNLRTRLRKAVSEQRGTKSAKTLEMLGSSIEDLMKHLESKFTEGMTWENYGQWHIDHIKPCASFNLEDPAEQKKCFHWTNLQPLWAKDNLVKGAKLQ